MGRKVFLDVKMNLMDKLTLSLSLGTVDYYYTGDNVVIIL